jgi:hypothetical protein
MSAYMAKVEKYTVADHSKNEQEYQNVLRTIRESADPTNPNISKTSMELATAHFDYGRYDAAFE